MDNDLFFSLPELTAYIEPSINGGKPNEDCSYDRLYIDPELKINKKLIKHVSYKLNNNAHRSDDFKKLNPDKTNILYAGCSVTFGQYLPEKYSWPYHLHEYLQTKFDVNEVNTLAFPGASISKIVNNILKYIDQYGAPDYIFFLIPDPFRYVLPTENGDTFQPVITYASHTGINSDCKPYRGVFESQQAFRILNMVCKWNNIKMYSYSWDSLTNKIFTKLELNNSDSINLLGSDKIPKELDLDKLLKYDKGFFINAADGLHPGLIENISYANNFIEMMENDKEN